MIVIAEESFAETLYYDGKYTINNEEGVEVEYEFTLVDLGDAIDITWIGQVPEERDNIESEISKEYQSR